MCVGILYKVQTHACRRVHRNVAVVLVVRAAIMFLASSGEINDTRETRVHHLTPLRFREWKLAENRFGSTLTFTSTRMTRENEKKKKLPKVHLCKRLRLLATCKIEMGEAFNWNESQGWK